MSNFSELDALIEAGWGDVPRGEIPPDWRSKPAPKLFYPQTEHGEQLRVPQRRRKRRTYAELRADRLVWDKPPSHS